jgi:two-component sensor histidine kinase/PAS domain-containing protein
MVTNYVYLSAVIVAGAVTTAMALNLWINRRIIESDFSIALSVCLWLWITMQIGECVAGPLFAKVLFYKVKFICISLVSVFMLGFALKHVRGKTRWLNRLLVCLAVPVVAAQVVTLFPMFESLAWKRFFTAPNHLLLDIEAAPGYVAFNIYNVLVLIVAYAALFVESISPRSAKRSQLLPFLAAGVFASCAVLMDFFLKQQLLSYRMTPIALAVSSLTVIYYLRLRYFRTIPLAQHAVSQSLSDGLLILSPENHIIYANPSAQRLFHVTPLSLIGKHLSSLRGDLTVAGGGADAEDRVNRIVKLDGRTFDTSLSPIRNRRRRVVSKVFVLRDVTHLKRVEESLRELTNELERKVAERTRQLEETNRELTDEVAERRRAEERIKASLEEKSVLLGELHHRVKNNLQIVSSLLKLQSHYVTDPAALELFDISVSRIRSMAMVHEKLYRSEDLAHTHFPHYLQELAQSVVFSHAKSSERIELALDVAPIDLDIDKSILAGLIVNELIMNSIKHAFPPDETTAARNRIALLFRRDGDDFVLEYGDSGPGLPAGFTLERSDSLGMKIIVTLVRQLKGMMDVLPGDGFRVRIVFPAAAVID